MNTDSPTPRDELEARLTALLLGQLTAAEEEALRQTMESDAELRRLHDRLRRTIGLVREAVASPGEVDRPPVEVLKLSNERREALQASFKTIRPKELARREQRRVQRRELALIAAMILGLLAVAGPMLFVNLAKKRSYNGDLRPAALAGRPAMPADEHRDSYSFRTSLRSDKNDTEAEIAPDFAQKRALGSVELFTRRRTERGEGELEETLRQEDPAKIASPPPSPGLSDLASSGGRSPEGGDNSVIAENVGALGGTGGATWAALGMPAPDHHTGLRFDGDRAVRAADLAVITPITGLPVGLAEIAKRVPKLDDVAAVGQGRALRELEDKAKVTGPEPAAEIPLPTLRPVEAEREDGLAFFSMPSRPMLSGSVPKTPPAAVPTASTAGASDRQSVLASGTERESLVRLNAIVEVPTERLGENLVKLVEQVQLPVGENQPTPAYPRARFGNDAGLATNSAFTAQLETYGAASLNPVDLLKNVNERLASNEALDRSGIRDQMATVVGQMDQKAVAQTEKESRSAGSRGAQFGGTELRREWSRRQSEDREMARVDPKAEVAGKGLESRAKVRVEERKAAATEADVAVARKPLSNAPVPQPEIITADNPFSTFSLNVSDVSFKLAAASLENGRMPDPATVRTEEFINAFDYRDPEPAGRQPLAFYSERARYPFAHNRDLVRFSVKTAASGRPTGRPLNLVLLLDNSGSMERADRQRIRLECLRVLAAQLQPSDRVSVVAFARTARLWVDGLLGSQGGELAGRVGQLTPEGGTNLEEAMNLAYQTARRHFQPGGLNRVVLLTDGAANLGDVEPSSLKQQVEEQRRQGVALDCFGLGWDGYNDDLLETLSRNGDGRYGFINTPEAAATEFAGQLAGALRVAASDVKVQIQFNPRRVTAYRQMGYAKHQLTQQQFRDNTVDAAEIGAAEAGNALYLVEVNPGGEGPLGVARVRFKVPGTSEYRELEWSLAYEPSAKAFDQAPSGLRLAGIAAAFSEWLVASPYAADVSPSRLIQYLSGVTGTYPNDPRPKQLEAMLRQAGSLSGK